MRKRIENVYGKALSGTFKVVNPVKKSIINTDCEVHVFIQANALEILKNEGYIKEYEFFKLYLPQINKGLIWADQDFKSYHHFYNPNLKRGKFGYEENALTVAKKYYHKSIKFFKLDKFELGLFYFGVACHIIQDLTIPQHAKGKLLDNHRQFEVYIKNNYMSIPRLKAKEGAIKKDTVEEYVFFNSMNALNYDKMYKDITNLKNKFYMLGTKCLPLAQKTSAGFMLMFFDDIFNNE
ncbi:MAG: zinc dependent phospholipase C family protein [Peptostreptococcaceae bacterium]